MIRLGVCADLDRIDVLAKIGYDYIEGNLTKLYGMDEGAYAELCARVDASPIRPEAFNCMMPPELKVVGEEVSAQALHEYFDRAFARAARLGGQIAVFGSGGSRRVPDGFPIDKAWRQIGNFLRLVQKHAVEHHLVVAVEPLRQMECNIINYVAEAVQLTSLLQLSNVGALCDTYHMAMGHEPYAALTLAGNMLKHAHTANSLGRRFPKEGDGEDYARLFSALAEGGYDARVSVEGGYEDFERDAEAAFSVLTAARNQVSL